MNHLTHTEYRELVDKVIAFNEETGSMPQYALVNNKKIDKEEYLDMIERVNRFVLEMGRSPKRVSIKKF